MAVGLHRGSRSKRVDTKSCFGGKGKNECHDITYDKAQQKERKEGKKEREERSVHKSVMMIIV